MSAIRLHLITAVVLTTILAFTGRAKAGTVVRDASADTFVTNSGNLANSVPDTQLLIGNSARSSGGFFSSAFILVQWDLTAFAGQTVVGDGTFALDVTSGNPFEAPTISAYETLAPWDQFVFSNQNGYGPSVDASVATSRSVDGGTPGYQSWALGRDVIQSWIDSPSTNHGLFLALEGETFFTFQSMESGFAPRLRFEIGAAAVPEPSSVVMLGLGALGLVGLSRRRRRAA